MNLLEHLAIRTISCTKEKAILTMAVTDHHKQPFGLLHGGINAVLIETACSLGANEHLEKATNYAAGIDIQVNHLKSVHKGLVTVIATPNRIGRSLQVWEATIFNEANEPTAVGRCTLINNQIKK